MCLLLAWWSVRVLFSARLGEMQPAGAVVGAGREHDSWPVMGRLLVVRGTVVRRVFSHGVGSSSRWCTEGPRVAGVTATCCGLRVVHYSRNCAAGYPEPQLSPVA